MNVRVSKNNATFIFTLKPLIDPKDPFITKKKLYSLFK